ncbi:MAG: radical SAM family heme chaperone HemW [Candidatus Caldatribacteriaceae bacterium]
MNSLSIYIHFPFCVQRCRYCDFVSYPWNNREIHQTYLEALKKELSIKAQTYALEGRKVETIYFGGGTPSLLEGKDIKKILEALKNVFPLSPEFECTLEVKPDRFLPSKIESWQQAGVNRLSIGVQSFDSQNLSFLGRGNDVETITENLQKVRNRYANWSVDLIYGLPFQDLERWQRDFETMISFRPPHFSIYNLVLHPLAPLYRFYFLRPRFFPPSEVEAVLWEWTERESQKIGYQRYEISNFAKPEWKCRHNLRYWSNQDYLGLGIAAWSYLKGIREHNTRHLQNYFRQLKEGKSPVVFREMLSPARRIGETIVLGLRRTEGISVQELAEYPLEVREKKIEILLRLVQEGWLQEKGGGFSLTPQGLLLANQVFAEIID